MYCKFCGKEIADNSKFCQYCGKSVGKRTINYVGLIKSFYDSHKKATTVVLILFVCVSIGWIWYSNISSVKIVGEWENVDKFLGCTDVDVYYADGTYKSFLDDCDFESLHMGSWEIRDGFLIKHFDELKEIERYEILKLTSEELVLRYVPSKYCPSANEHHYKRRKD
jgi:hypothetical protein